MKKQCTNPACRRTFIPRFGVVAPACPHCGRNYPRLGKSRGYYLQLSGYTALKSLVPMYRLYRKEFPSSFSREVRAAIRNSPKKSVVFGPYHHSRAKELLEEWTAAGAIICLKKI